MLTLVRFVIVHGISQPLNELPFFVVCEDTVEEEAEEEVEICVDGKTGSKDGCRTCWGFAQSFDKKRRWV